LGGEFKVRDVRDSKAWQQVHNEGVAEGIEKGIEKEMIQSLVAQGMTHKQIAELIKLPLEESDGSPA
jgi:hypothetical protein